MSEHTPGPWFCLGTLVMDGNTDVLTDVFQGEGANAEADARLMAAAPRLLAALERLRGAYDSAIEDADLREAEGAIAEARGETT